MAERRQLDFRAFDDMFAEIDRLRHGYRRMGNWDLAYICDHLATVPLGAIKGYRRMAPWLIRKTIGPVLLGRILKTRRMKAGIRIPESMLPKPGKSEEQAVADLRRATDAMRDFAGDYAEHPIFGHVRRDQFQQLHLIHAAHHLGFLSPVKTERGS